MIFIPITHHGAYQAGSAYKPVICEQCSKAYVYRVKRQGEGGAHSVLFIDEEGAKRQAAKQAEKNLQKALNRAVEIVPCPGCGWIQAHMQILARQKYLPRVKILGIASLCALMVPLFVLGANLTLAGNRPMSPRLLAETSCLAAFLFIAGAGLLIYRRIQCNLYDPNDCDLDYRLQEGQRRAVLVADSEKSKQ